ncbi:hypothetical protein DFH27DRAFT_82123 [Peziza echinospora]|nr:hypothetical protein DFH27DRAFT_82123 [Peziza echinospora]
MTTPPSVQNLPPSIFEQALSNFKKQLTTEELDYFERTKLKDVHEAIHTIQFDQKQRKRMQTIARIKPFVDCMEQYGKVIDVFLNVEKIVAFVWGPLKFILTIASQFADAFDTLLDAYAQLGECLPQFQKYDHLFGQSPEMQRVLGYVFEDVLEFHRRVLKIFKRKFWEVAFQVTWGGFKVALNNILQNMSRHKRLVENEASIIHFQEFQASRRDAELAFQRLEKAEEKRQRHEILQWLCINGESNPSTDYEKYCAIRRGYPESGKWLAGCNEFQEWAFSGNTTLQLLWLYGIPGAGKTILSSYILEMLKMNTQATVVWFFCKFSDLSRNTFLAVTRGILAQLLTRNPDLAPYFLEIMEKDDDHLTLNSPAAIQRLLEHCMLQLDNTYVLIDGLDECESKERKDIITLFGALSGKINSHQPGALRALFVSTDEGDIRKQVTQLKPTIIHLKSDHTRHEMSLYAHSRMREIKDTHGLTEEDAKKIVEDVVDRSDGMYLYCYLVMEHLLGQATREELREASDPDLLPHGLNAAYEKILHRIDTHLHQSLRKHARRILGWIACAKRCLRWHEIQGALSVGVDGTFNLEERRLRIGVKELFGALIELGPSGTVEFVHSSAKLYIINERTISSTVSREPWIDLSAGCSDMALRCVRYLSLRSFSKTLSESEVRDYVHRGFYSFQDYATSYWLEHVEMSLENNRKCSITDIELITCLNTFLNLHWVDEEITSARGAGSKKVFRLFEQLKSDEFRSVYRRIVQFKLAAEKAPSNMPPPFINFRQQIGTVRKCLEEANPIASQVQTMNDYYGLFTPSFKCTNEKCSHYHEGFASATERTKHLKEHERPFLCKQMSCPASTLGFPSERQLELHTVSKHAEIDPEPEFGTLPLDSQTQSYLIEAVETGNIDWLNRLLIAGADVNMKDSQELTALHHAITRGNEKMVKVLLDSPLTNISFSSSTGSPMSYIYTAIHSGNAGILGQLFNAEGIFKPTDIDTYLWEQHRCPFNKDAIPCTLPFCAAKLGHFDIVKILLHRAHASHDERLLNIARIDAIAGSTTSQNHHLYLARGPDDQGFTLTPEFDDLTEQECGQALGVCFRLKFQLSIQISHEPFNFFLYRAGRYGKPPKWFLNHSQSHLRTLIRNGDVSFVKILIVFLNLREQCGRLAIEEQERGILEVLLDSHSASKSFKIPMHANELLWLHIQLRPALNHGQLQGLSQSQSAALLATKIHSISTLLIEHGANPVAYGLKFLQAAFDRCTHDSVDGARLEAGQAFNYLLEQYCSENAHINHHLQDLQQAFDDAMAKQGHQWALELLIRKFFTLAEPSSSQLQDSDCHPGDPIMMLELKYDCKFEVILATHKIAQELDATCRVGILLYTPKPRFQLDGIDIVGRNIDILDRGIYVHHRDRTLEVDTSKSFNKASFKACLTRILRNLALPPDVQIQYIQAQIDFFTLIFWTSDMEYWGKSKMGKVTSATISELFNHSQVATESSATGVHYCYISRIISSFVAYRLTSGQLGKHAVRILYFLPRLLRLCIESNAAEGLRALLDKFQSQSSLDGYQKTLLFSLKLNNDDTIFHYAARKGTKEIMEVLFSFSPLDPDIKDKTGNTALYFAVKRLRPELVDMLLANKARPDIPVMDVQVESSYYTEISLRPYTIIAISEAAQATNNDAKINSNEMLSRILTSLSASGAIIEEETRCSSNPVPYFLQFYTTKLAPLHLNILETISVLLQLNSRGQARDVNAMFEGLAPALHLLVKVTEIHASWNLVYLREMIGIWQSTQSLLTFKAPPRAKGELNVLAIAETLLQHGADTHMKNKWGQTVIEAIEEVMDK